MILVVKYSLSRDDIGGVGSARANTSHYGDQDLSNAIRSPSELLVIARTCSLIVKGPGLRSKPKTLTLGTNLAHALPTGSESS
jgi:hypothetical protein